MHELIEKYFENQLTEAEKLEFDKLLAEDADFKQEFEFYSELKNAIAVSERQKLKKEIQQFESEDKTSVFYLKHYFKYAAVLLIMFSLIIYFTTNFNLTADLYASYYKPYPNTAVSNTRSSLNEQSIIKQAFIAYDLNNFDEANKLFESALIISKEDHILFYKAICLMELNKHYDALQIFEKRKWSEEYVEKGLWFQSLCYLKLNEKGKAKETLKLLIEKKSFKSSEAEELFSKL